MWTNGRMTRGKLRGGRVVDFFVGLGRERERGASFYDSNWEACKSHPTSGRESRPKDVMPSS